MNLSFDWLDRYRDLGLFVMRTVIGGTFVFHGWNKLMAGPKVWTKLGGAMANFGLGGGELYWGLGATFAELLGGICLVLGVFVRPSAMALCGTMVVAAVVKFQAVNWAANDTVSAFFYPLTMAAVACGLVFLGGGRLALDLRGGSSAAGGSKARGAAGAKE